MPAVTLKAHFDGQHIVPDEHVDLPLNTPLAVTVSPAAEAKLAQEHADWSALAVRDLQRAYGDDEPEYSLADLKRPS